MTPSKPLRLLAAVSVVAVLAGCSTVGKLNPFGRGGDDRASSATQGERIPVIFADDAIAPAEALKGQDFFLPDAQPVVAWPQAGGTPGQPVENAAAAPAFQIAWRRGVGSGSTRHRHLTATPVAADGKVFTMDAQATVSALDAKSGARLWQTDLKSRERRDKDGFGGGVAYADGKLFVTSGYRVVAALDPASGAVLWKTNVGSPIHGAPSVIGGKVMAVDLDDKLTAFDVATGAEVWSYQGLTEPARILAASAPAVTEGSVVAAFASGELVALLPANGNDLWSQSLSRSNRNNALSEIRDIAGRPVIFKDIVYAASHSGVFAAVDLRTGGGKWVLPVSSITTPWAAGDVVYIISKGGELMAVSRETGQIYWIKELNPGGVKASGKRGGFFGRFGRGAKIATYWSGPVLASGRLIVVSSQGQALALDPKTGAQQSALNLGGPALLTPIAMDGLLYVQTDNGELVAIR